MKKREWHNLMRDIGIVGMSILVAFLLIKTGTIRNIFTETHGLKIIGSFFGGMFFVSIFTAAPALVFLIEVARSNSIFLVALPLVA